MTAPVPLRVLLAEDEALIAMALRWTLEARGHVVAHVADGLDALAALDTAGPFDALVTDMRMPRMDGEELIRRVRATLPDLPVVVVTAFASRQMGQVMATMGGPYAILEKPVAFDAVADQVERIAAPPPA
jgi:CheY-like chemotaxis protein